MKFAVIETGGKQYIVAENQKVRIEKLPEAKGGEVKFDKVLLVADGKETKIGNPLVAGAAVSAEVTEHGRGRKVIVFKYHAKTRYRKKRGHRQHFTEVLIKKILGK